MLTQQTTLLVPIEPEALELMMRQAIRSELASYIPPAPAKPLPPFLTRKEVATLYRVSLTTLNDWDRQGFLPEKRILKGRVLYNRDEVLATLETVKGMKHKKRVS
ncbi:MAG: MerR family transcriptional regulator [Bacteroidetes bacterium]|nr:MerR family transcriptional regulator [Bacteroidota bacterium]